MKKRKLLALCLVPALLAGCAAPAGVTDLSRQFEAGAPAPPEADPAADAAIGTLGAELLRAARPGALALGGMLSEEAKAIAAEAGVELVDYFAREELTIRNAIPTAEGCIGILMKERSRTLWGSSILLTGFGPVGQALGVRLAALGAQVTAAARRPAQRAMAESFGLRSVPIDRLGQIAPAFDTVVNTVPAPVLSEAVLARLRPQSFIVDLASRPGGTDFDAARRLGHRAIHALSLPAACAPETAGEAVAQTVCDMIGQREEAS